MNSRAFVILTKIFFVAIAFVFSANLLFGKYNIFNYIRKKNLIDTLNMELQEKNRIRDRLSKKAVILRHESKVDIDILESETIRKLNKIEQGYFIITD